MAEKERPLYTLYKGLKANNFDVPDNYDSFERTLTEAGNGGANSRHTLYNSLKEQNFDVPDTYERFYSNLFTPVNKNTSRALGGAAPMSAADKARFSASAAAISAQAGQAMRRAKNTQRAAKLKQQQEKQRNDFGRVDLGTRKTPYGTDNAVKDNFGVDPVTGKAGTYITSSGEEIGNEFEAGQQQQAEDKFNDAYNAAVDSGDIPSAFDVVDKDGNYDLYENVGKNGTHVTEQGKVIQLDAKIADAYRRKQEIIDSLSNIFDTMKTGGNLDERMKLMNAKSQVEDEIRSLEAVRNQGDRSILQNGWQGFKDATFKQSAWDFGINEFQTMGQMELIKSKLDNGIPLTKEEQMIAQSKIGADAAAALADKEMGKAYRWSGIAGQSVPFMLDFYLTGGFGGLTHAAGKAAVKYAAKKGMGAFGKNVLKYTGVTAANIVGSYAMAGTEQAFKTGADIMNRHMGTLYQDEDGNYKFGTFDDTGNLVNDGGEGFGTALYKGLTAAMLENYTEKVFRHTHFKRATSKAFAAHFPKFASFLATKGAPKWMKRLGIDGLGEEIMEEEINIPLNSLLVGDNKLSDLGDLQQQGDIIFGIGLSVGAMYAINSAPKGAAKIYNSAQYYKFKNAMGNVDSRLQSMMGDRWDAWKDKIDNTPNEKMGALTKVILQQKQSGSLNEEEINTIGDYISNLAKVRGYNLAKTTEVEAKEQTGEETTPEDEQQQEQEQAYAEGQDAEGEEKHEIQMQTAEAEGVLASMLGVSEDQLESIDLESMLGENDDLDLAIYDYQNSQARYQGVMDNAQSKVDAAEQNAIAEVRRRTDTSRGTVRNATIKSARNDLNGGEDYGVFIVSGNLAQNEDGTINTADSDQMILYFDPLTGKIEHGDASRFASLGEEVDAELATQQAIELAKQDAIAGVTRDIDGKIGEGSRFVVTDNQGQQHVYEVLADNGDGTASISIDGNVMENVFPTMDELQKMKDDSDKQRIANTVATKQAEREKQQAAEEQKKQEAEEKVNTIDFSQLIDPNGTITTATIEGEEDKLGFVVGYTPSGKLRIAYLNEDGTIEKRKGLVSPDKVMQGEPMAVDEYKTLMGEQLATQSTNSEVVDESATKEVEGSGLVDEALTEENEPEPIGTGVFGNIYNQFKGKVKDAFNFLMKHKSGDLLGVFHRDDVGDIDLVWGNEKMGLAHIIGKHVGEGKDFSTVDAAFAKMDEVIKDGSIIQETDNRYVINKDGFRVAIRKNFDGKEKKWIVSAVDYNRSKEEKGITTNPTSASHGASEPELAALNDSEGKDNKNPSNGNEEKQTLTFADGTPVPMLEDGNPDFSKMTAEQAAELYDSQFGEDAEQILSNSVADAKKVLDKAKGKPIKGKTFLEQKASKDANDKAVADAQAAYDNAKAVSNAYQELLIDRSLGTVEGRQNLLDKAKRKYDRLKNTDEWKDNQQALWDDTVGKVLHRLYDGTSVDVFDPEPRTVEEYVSSNLAPFSLNYEGTKTAKGVKQETGLERKDFAKSKVLAAEGKGQTVDAFVHKLWQNRPPQLESATDQDIRNAVIGLITGNMNAYDMRHVIENNRIAEAEKEIEDEQTAAENAAYQEEQRKAAEEEEKKKDEEEKASSSSEDNAVPTSSNNQAKSKPRGTGWKRLQELMAMSPEEREAELKKGNQEVGEEERTKVMRKFEEEKKAFSNQHSNEYASVLQESDTPEEAASKFREMAAERRAVAADWASRKYKDNNAVLDSHDIYGEEKQTTVNAANERRRHAAINNALSAADEYDDMADTILKRSGLPIDTVPVKKSASTDSEAQQNEQQPEEQLHEDAADNMPFGEQLNESDLPFSPNDENKVVGSKERKEMVDKNKVTVDHVSEAFIPKKLQRGIARIAKMMPKVNGKPLTVQYLYSADADGWFDRDTNTLYLALDSSKALQMVFGHEMTHAIKSMNASSYDELKGLVKEFLGEDFDKAVDATEQFYNAHGVTYPNREDYEEEVIADGIGTIINDLNLTKGIALRMSHPLLAAFHNILMKIRLAFRLADDGTYERLTHAVKVIEKAYVDTMKMDAANVENTTGEQGTAFSIRQKPDPENTIKCYKLMRLGEDGKLYPLFIDAKAPTELGIWYDGDSPNLEQLKGLPSGVHLVDNETGKVTSFEDWYNEHTDLYKKGNGNITKMGKLPSKEAINWATLHNARFMYIEDTKRGQNRFGGEARKYWNLGINGSGTVSTFSMRPGWHAGSLPTMRQIGKGKEKNLRDDNFVWVEGEISADIDYNEEAQKNPDKDIPNRIPEDGYYLKATNANKSASQADRVGWYVAGAFKANRIMGDAEARKVIDDWNANHPDLPVEYDYERESGLTFNADTMRLEDKDGNPSPKFSLKVYHGSGADFDEFDFDHMGEGAGSQAFGWGGYVTTSEKIGKSYATLMDNDPSRSNVVIRNGSARRFIKKYPTLESFLHSMADKDNLTAQEKTINKHFTEQEKIDYYNERAKDAEPYHNMYEVEIPDDNGKNYLEWDKPLTDAQKNIIAKQLKRLKVDVADYERRGFSLDASFSDVYNFLTYALRNTKKWQDVTATRAASKFLSSLGYTGIKYPAGTIMGGAEKGDTNYVIFKPEDMNIASHSKFSIRTYHGSQASFDKFDHSFMGSGEGAQAYGWGTYVSEVEGIAKAYAKQNAKKNAPSRLMYQGKPMTYKTPNVIYQVALDMDRNNISAKEAISKMIDAYEKKLASVGDTPFEKMKAKQVQDELNTLKGLNPSDFKINEDYDTVAQNLADVKSGLSFAEEELKNANSYVELYQSRLNEAKKNLEKAKASGTGLGVDMYEGDAEYYNRQVERSKHKAKTMEEDVKDIKAKVDALQKQLDSMEKPRNLYTVEIPDDTGDNYIDWDGSLSENAALNIAKGLVAKDIDAAIDMFGMYGNFIVRDEVKELHDRKNEIKKDKLSEKLGKAMSGFRGGAIYEDLTTVLGGQKEASLMLKDAGFDGVKVIAQRNSGGNKQGNMNYVIFDEDNAKIVNHTKFSLRDEQIHSEQFKDWFGDWEKDPKNASKVVDENGEPLVVYHGTTNDETKRVWNEKTKSYDTSHEPFTVFKREVDGLSNSGLFFNSSENNAYEYGYNNYAVYLNARNPLVIDCKGSLYNSIRYDGKTMDTYDWANWAEENEYDGVIFKNIKDGVDYGSMQDTTDDYVVFKSNQIKSATDNNGDFSSKNNDIRFSLKDPDKTMFGMHNISVDKLRKAIKQGGFAAPSMGVVDSKNGVYSDYGEITLIPKAEKLDKRKGKNAGTFTADAWTPTYPQVTMRQNKEGKEKLHADTLLNNNIPEELGKNLLNRWESFINTGTSRPNEFAWQYMFENGMNPKVTYSKSAYPKSISNKVMKITDNGVKRMNELTKEENGELIKLYNAYLEKKGEGLDENAVKEIIGYLEEWKKKEDVGIFKDNIQRKIDYFKEFGGDINKAQDWAWKEVVPAAKSDGKVNHAMTLYYATIKADSDKKMQADLQKWFDAKLKEYGVDEYLYNGETASGNPKYVPNTVENAVKIMKKQGLAGGYNDFAPGVGAFIAKYAPTANTLAAMKKNKDKLIPSGDERHKEVRDMILGEYNDLARSLTIKPTDAFDDSGTYRMQELADVKPKDLKKYIADNWNKEVSDGWVERYNELVDTIKNDYPVYYFETKFMRPYGLDEFEKAIVPKNTPTDVMDALKKAGIDVRTYEGKEDREKVTMDAINDSDDIKFSIRSFGTDIADASDEIKQLMNNEKNISRRIGSRAQAQSRVLATLSRASDEFRRSNRASARSGQDTWEKDRALGYVVRASYGTGAFLTEEEIKEITSAKIGSGEENQVFLAKDGKTVIKLNNFLMVDKKFRFNEFVDRIKAHNEFAPNDMYIPLGFALNPEGDFCLVLEQPYVDGKPATQEEIDDYLEYHGFDLAPVMVSEDEIGTGWSDGNYEIWDTKPRNVLKDKNGDLHFIDTVIQHTVIDGHNDNLRFSLRYSDYEKSLSDWKKRNGLPKDAKQPEMPQQQPNESKFDYMKRVNRYLGEKALWKTAPTYEGHLLFGDTAVGYLNSELQRGSVLARIAMQDSMLAVRKAQEGIMKELGLDKLGVSEDAYTAENRSHGKGKNEFEEYNQIYLQPLRKAYHAMKKLLGDSYDNVKVYMMSKHGLERNAFIAFREALKKDFTTKEKGKKDVFDASGMQKAYNGYKVDINRINNDADYAAGKIDYATYRQNDDAIRTKYAPSYPEYRYDDEGNVRDYAGLSALYSEAADFEIAAAANVKDVEDAHNAEAAALWDATNASTKKILKDSYLAGMMSKSVYDYVKGMYNNYIPLRGWDGTSADQVWDYVGGGRGAFNQAMKKAGGRKSIADDPIAYIENMAESGILLNNKNWVKQHLLLLAENHPTSMLSVSKAWYVKSRDAQGNEIWTISSPNIPSDMTDPQKISQAIAQFDNDMRTLEAMGEATQKRGHLDIVYPQTNGEEREHEVRVLRDGEEYVIYVNGDPQLAQAMNNVRAQRVRENQTGLLDRASAWLGRKMAAAYTSLSPLFIPANFTRDLTMTLASTAIREDGRYNYLLRKNFLTHWNTMPLVIKYQNGTLKKKVDDGSATESEKMFYEFMMNGGETGFVSTMEVEDFKKKIQNELKDMDRWKANPKRVGHAIMDSIELLNRAIEDSNRFLVYMTSRQYGRPIEEAINNAKDVTLNFNRKGTGEYGWQMLRNLYLFVNPAIQSLQTLGALAKNHPYKFTAVTSLWLASGALVPVVNSLLLSMFGGDDDKDKYWSFSKWDRRNNFIMWIPYTKNFVKIPLAQEFRGFYAVGDMIASKLMGGEKAEESWSDYASDLAGQIVDMLPLDPTGYDGNVVVSLMPNAVRPIFELAFNVDFTGKPLFNDSEYNKYDPNFTKAYVGTPDWLVRTSKLVNSINNPYPDVQQNAIDRFGNPRYNLNNPAVVDHVLSSYLGGAYTFGSQAVGVLTKALNADSEIKVADIPLLSRFAANPDDRPVTKKQGDAFWTMKEQQDRTANTLSKLKKEAKVSGDFSTLEGFYKSDQYAKFKENAPRIKQYEEDKKKEKAEKDGEEYKAHKLTGSDIYKKHASSSDDFEDMKMDLLWKKVGSYKTVYDGMVSVGNSQSESYYGNHAAAIDAADEAYNLRSDINGLKKGMITDDGKDGYNADDMKQIRELRKQAISILENAAKSLPKPENK